MPGQGRLKDMAALLILFSGSVDGTPARMLAQEYIARTMGIKDAVLGLAYDRRLNRSTDNYADAALLYRYSRPRVQAIARDKVDDQYNILKNELGMSVLSTIRSIVKSIESAGPAKTRHAELRVPAVGAAFAGRDHYHDIMSRDAASHNGRVLARLVHHFFSNNASDRRGNVNALRKLYGIFGMTPVAWLERASPVMKEYAVLRLALGEHSESSSTLIGELKDLIH